MHHRILGEHWCIYSCLQTQHRENWFQIVRWNTQQQLTFPALLPFAPTIDLLILNIYGTFHVHRNSIFYYFFHHIFIFFFCHALTLKWPIYTDEIQSLYNKTKHWYVPYSRQNGWINEISYFEMSTF